MTRSPVSVTGRSGSSPEACRYRLPAICGLARSSGVSVGTYGISPSCDHPNPSSIAGVVSLTIAPLSVGSTAIDTPQPLPAPEELTLTPATATWPVGPREAYRYGT